MHWWTSSGSSGRSVGHTTRYQVTDMELKGCAALGQFPIGAIPQALYIEKLGTSTGIVTPGGSQSGLDLTITTWAELAAVVTSGVGLPFVKIWIEEATGLEHIVRLLAGTDATDTANGIQRPDDYDAASNARIWYQVGSAA